MDFDFSLAPPQLTDIENLQATVDELWLSCRRFTSEINELKEKLNINPQNSSLPPSTVPPFTRKQPTPAQKKWWQSKPGAVLGHKGYGQRGKSYHSPHPYPSPGRRRVSVVITIANSIMLNRYKTI